MCLPGSRSSASLMTSSSNFQALELHHYNISIGVTFPSPTDSQHIPQAIMSVGVQALPVDLFHLLAAELSDRLDYSTLYNCIVSSKTLASSGTVNALYR